MLGAGANVAAGQLIKSEVWNPSVFLWWHRRSFRPAALVREAFLQSGKAASWDSSWLIMAVEEKTEEEEEQEEINI